MPLSLYLPIRLILNPLLRKRVNNRWICLYSQASITAPLHLSNINIINIYKIKPCLLAFPPTYTFSLVAYFGLCK